MSVIKQVWSEFEKRQIEETQQRVMEILIEAQLPKNQEQFILINLYQGHVRAFGRFTYF